MNESQLQGMVGVAMIDKIIKDARPEEREALQGAIDKLSALVAELGPEGKVACGYVYMKALSEDDL